MMSSKETQFLLENTVKLPGGRFFFYQLHHFHYKKEQLFGHTLSCFLRANSTHKHKSALFGLPFEFTVGDPTETENK